MLDPRTALSGLIVLFACGVMAWVIIYTEAAAPEPVLCGADPEVTP